MSQYVLEGTRMKCPKCGGTENLSRNEVVLCSALIDVHENGRWSWNGETKVHWDTQEYRKEIQDEAEWRCRDCDIDFEAPDIKEGDADEPAVENG